MTNIYEEVAEAIRKTQIDRVAVTLPFKDDYIAMAKAAVDAVLDRLVSDEVADVALHAYYGATDDGVYPRAIKEALKAAAEAIRGTND